jgi:tetratricopeptide (TPR) repeat protein
MLASRPCATLLFACLAASACASAPSASDRFIKKNGPGFVDVGGAARALSQPDKDAIARAEREARSARAAQTSPPVVETRDRALKEALSALGASPSAATHLEVARQYRRLGVRDLAFDHYSDALAYDPRNATAFDGRARLWRDWGFLGLALADAHRARYFRPASAEAHNTLGTILERQGLCQQALAEYQEAARLDPAATWAGQNARRVADNCGEGVHHARQ